MQWEDKFKEIINEKREKEMILMRKRLNYSVVLIVIHWVMPLVLCLTTIGAYVKINNKFIDIANLLISLEIFDNIRNPLVNLPDRIREVINVYVSLNRLADFLKIPTKKQSNITKNRNKDYSVEIINSDIGMNKDKILIRINELKIKKGESAIVLGETGSGKSCLIKSLINRLNIIRGEVFNIDGIISYASQTPFIINSTLRNNILFYSEYDEERYNNVIQICELGKDIDSLPAGDQTEIGTNGANISGGQKSRINLARCIYKNADIYLFDDPISSVDSIVYSKIIIGLTQNFLKNKTIIFSSNSTKYMNNFDKVIFFEKEKIIYQGNPSEIISKKFFEFFRNKDKKKINDEEDNLNQNGKMQNNIINLDWTKTEDKQSNGKGANKLSKNEKEKSKNKGKLMLDEDLNTKRTTSEIFHSIIEYSGGYLQFILVFISAIVWQFTIILGNIYLTNRSSNSKTTVDENIYNFMIYTLFGLGCIFSLFIKEFLVSRMNYNISKNLHDKMLDNIIDAPINLYHDITPFGQIMNKFTIDLDKSVVFFKHFSSTLKYLCTLLGAIIVCILANKYSLLYIPFIYFIGFRIAMFYAPAGRNLLRIESIDRTPLISYYSESIQGIDTIKSLSYYNIDKKFFSQFFEKVLKHLSISLYKFGTRTFFELSLDLLSTFFVLILYLYCILYHQNYNAVTIGLLLKYSLNISEEILTMLTHGTELENSFIRVERCELATHLPKENFTGTAEINDKTSLEGNIKIENLYIKYSPNLDYTLENINLNIKLGEKICAVGRTGSGKSTIILGLFRLIEANKGAIYLNKINIKNIPLKILRRCLSIVPQEPKIFGGTLKFNLDPQKKFSDFEISNAIKEVGLFNLMKENGRDTSKKLNMKLKEDGENLSLGEKQ